MSEVSVIESAEGTLARRGLANAETPVLLMVSGGSDSVALAYIAVELAKRSAVGTVAMLHVNHHLRGEDSDGDARFVTQLAELLEIPLFMCDVDVAGEVARTGGNVEAVARHERYVAANEALASLCAHVGAPLADGRIFTAHTADDRAENFYMRSIVGTGPGGFRAMRYKNGAVVRPLLDVSRETLRDFLRERAAAELPVQRDEAGALWREDATNAHTDHFRAYVRHEIVPRAKERNPQLLETLTRTMNLIADEDDMLETIADDLLAEQANWVSHLPERAPEYDAGCVLAPAFGQAKVPLQRRALVRLLQLMLGADVRVETASVEAVLAAWEAGGTPEARPQGGYATNIQGNLAVSANKQGVRVEPMAAFRARRKK